MSRQITFQVIYVAYIILKIPVAVLFESVKIRILVQVFLK